MEGDNFIMITEKNFFELIDKVVSHLEKLQGKDQKEVWIDSDSAKKLLGIKSDTSLFHLRSQGLIEYSQPSRKIILYKRESLLKYLEKHSHKTFDEL
ncbi:DNA-binding protein [Kordia sp. TARA_039_SRF]|nr:DNA-binding protein [Kordia sp. TARA_039_SRF]